MSTPIPRGVRKSSELIMQEGRAPIITETDESKLDWSKIPNGALFVNPKTGIMQVKLEGETSWVPAGIKNDGTIEIAKDSRIIKETFIIKTLNDNDGFFSVINSAGEIRHFPITEDGKYVFELEQGSYQPQRNSLEVILDDVLIRDAVSGGVEELTDKRFALTEKLYVNQEVTVKYTNVLRIGNPYPRIFVSKTIPTNAEEGDWWLDTNPAPYIGNEIVDVIPANSGSSNIENKLSEENFD